MQDEICPDDSMSCVSSNRSVSFGRQARRKKSDVVAPTMPPPTRILKLGKPNPTKGVGRRRQAPAPSSKGSQKGSSVATCGNCGAKRTDEEAQWLECVGSTGCVERMGVACQKCLDGFKIREGAKQTPEEQLLWLEFIMQRKSDSEYRASTDKCISAAGQQFVGNSEVIEIEDAGFECFRDYEMVAPGDIDKELGQEVMPETRVCVSFFFFKNHVGVQTNPSYGSTVLAPNLYVCDHRWEARPHASTVGANVASHDIVVRSGPGPRRKAMPRLQL